jgi:membrane fusion protein, heavy metal efflux system
MHKIAFIVLLVTASSCSPNQGSNPGQEADTHQHEGSAFQVTRFSEHYEFYMTSEPIEVSEEAELLVHLTDLSSYKPCSSGYVSIRMDGMTATAPEPAEPGIFILQLIPENEGSYQAELMYHNGNIKESVSVQIDVSPPHEEGHEGAPVEEEDAHNEQQTGEILFSKEQAWKSGFMVKEVRKGPFQAVIPTSGEIMAMPGEKKNITAGSHGIIRFTDPLLVQGSAVHKGQPLFMITSENMVDDNLILRYNEAKNSLQKSRSDFNRHLVLYKQQTISERQFLESKSIYTADSLRYYSLASSISEDGVRVVATVSGTIHELNVADGEYAEPGRIMAVLSTNRALMLRADLPQQYYKELGQIQSAHFRPAYSKRVFTMEEMGGSLLAAGVSVAENDHYLPVIFRLENSGDLLEGAFAEVFLIAGSRGDLLSIPASSLAEEQGGYYVYVQVSGEGYMKRSVSIGATNGLDVEITSGLKAGERVVTEGVMLVKAASMSTGAIQDEHHH